MVTANLELTHLGRYRVLEELGRGAMGVVHKAEDPSLGRVVAIKAVLLSNDAADSMEYQARFYQEAKAAGSLNHPGIITIYDTGREGNWAYIAMEMLEGVELRKLMANARLPLPLILDIAAQVASALDFAHERGVVHRDIKPANIMVLRGDQAKIMDFGIARMRVSEVQTQVGLVLGSPKYMSPEQVSGRRVDHRSDIFSLGVVLFEMLAGIAPFSGKDMGDLMYTVVNTQQPRPSQLNPAIPDFLDLIVAKALQKEVAARYQSAREFATDLAACRAALGDVSDTSSTLGERTVPLGIAATVPGHAPVGEVARTRPIADVPDSVPGHSPIATGAATATETPTVPLASDSVFDPPPVQLMFSRRVSSAQALARLAQPTADDLKKLSSIPAAPSRLPRLLGSGENRTITLIITAALCGALAIAFY
ncbi:MAG: serine/threonine-protein kinase [Betaproteobacteria bacterium]